MSLPKQVPIEGLDKSVYEPDKKYGPTIKQVYEQFDMEGQAIFLIELSDFDIEYIVDGGVIAIEINGDEFHVAVRWRP